MNDGDLCNPCPGDEPGPSRQRQPEGQPSPGPQLAGQPSPGPQLAGQPSPGPQLAGQRSPGPQLAGQASGQGNADLESQIREEQNEIKYLSSYLAHCEHTLEDMLPSMENELEYFEHHKLELLQKVQLYVDFTENTAEDIKMMPKKLRRIREQMIELYTAIKKHDRYLKFYRRKSAAIRYNFENFKLQILAQLTGIQEEQARVQDEARKRKADLVEEEATKKAKITVFHASIQEIIPQVDELLAMYRELTGDKKYMPRYVSMLG